MLKAKAESFETYWLVLRSDVVLNLDHLTDFVELEQTERLLSSRDAKPKRDREAHLIFVVVVELWPYIWS